MRRGWGEAGNKCVFVVFSKRYGIADEETCMKWSDEQAGAGCKLELAGPRNPRLAEVAQQPGGLRARFLR
jgi:hypothetical protein